MFGKFCSRVVGRDFAIGMAKQRFTSFQWNARTAKSPPKCMTQIVNTFQDAGFDRPQNLTCQYPAEGDSTNDEASTTVMFASKSYTVSPAGLF